MSSTPSPRRDGSPRATASASWLGAAAAAAALLAVSTTTTTTTTTHSNGAGQAASNFFCHGYSPASTTAFANNNNSRRRHGRGDRFAQSASPPPALLRSSWSLSSLSPTALAVSRGIDPSGGGGSSRRTDRSVSTAVPREEESQQEESASSLPWNVPFGSLWKTRNKVFEDRREKVADRGNDSGLGGVTIEVEKDDSFSIPTANDLIKIVQPDVDTHEEKRSVAADQSLLKQKDEEQQRQLLSPVVVGGVAVAAAVCAAASVMSSAGVSLQDGQDLVASFIDHPQETMSGVLDSVRAAGPMGALYFGMLYTAAEIFAVPATPLTLSAGYLFGLSQGVTVVLLAATVAASVGFFVGRTFLRSWVEQLLEDNPAYSKLDRAVGREGFKLLLLVRLSPLFPFSISNYLYGASSIDFPSYFWGTLLGFAPGTAAYVYTGMVGQALSTGNAQEPWYVYAGGLAALCGVLKLVTDVATEIVSAIDDDDDDDNDENDRNDQGGTSENTKGTSGGKVLEAASPFSGFF